MTAFGPWAALGVSVASDDVLESASGCRMCPAGSLSSSFCRGDYWLWMSRACHILLNFLLPSETSLCVSGTTSCEVRVLDDRAEVAVTHRKHPPLRVRGPVGSC